MLKIDFYSSYLRNVTKENRHIWNFYTFEKEARGAKCGEREDVLVKEGALDQ